MRSALLATAFAIVLCVAAPDFAGAAVLTRALRDPVPSLDLRNKSLNDIKTLYKEEYAASESGYQARRELAKKLLDASEEKGWTPSDHYVLVDQAREFFVLGLDLPNALAIVKKLADAYSVDGADLRFEAITRIAPDVRRVEIDATGAFLLDYIQGLVNGGDLFTAERLMEHANKIVRKSEKQADIRKTYDALLVAIDQKRQLTRAASALESNAEDEDANLVLGSYQCFDQGDFEHGVALLAHSTPGELREIATLDAAAPMTPTDRRTLAEKWFTWAKKKTGNMFTRGLDRARHWYQLAALDLERFDLLAVNKKIEEIDKALGEAKTQPAPVAPPPPRALTAMDRLRSDLVRFLSSQSGLTGTVMDDRTGVVARYELELNPIDPTRGWIEGKMRWVENRTGVDKVKGEVETRDDLVLISFREQVAKPEAGVSKIYTAAGATYYLRVTILPREGSLLTGDWTQEEHSGPMTLQFSAKPTGRAPGATAAAPEAAPAALKPITWGDVLEPAPSARVITEPEVRKAIAKVGLPWRVRDRVTGVEMLLVPPGSYERGANQDDLSAGENERPQHQVTLSKPFYVSRYELQQAEWSHVIAGKPLDASVQGLPFQARQYSQVKQFLAKSGGLRLLTEAEWEYACRAGTKGPVYGKLSDVAWCPTNSEGVSHWVGQLPPNAFGLHDMLGNVWEVCQDVYSDNEYARCASGVTDPKGPVSGSTCVIRGGAANARRDTQCRASNRASQDRDGVLTLAPGLRLARDP